MKQILVWMGCLLPLLSACRAGQSEQEQRRLVKIDTVRSTAPLVVMQYPGRVKASQDVNLAFKVSGTIERFAVTDGTQVKQGQLLVELDPTDYQVQLNATEAEYQQIKAEAQRVMAIYADSATSASNYDKAVYGLKQITAKYQHHKDQLAYTKIYAPFTGTVQKRLFEAHETVGAGMPVISMVSHGEPEVEINLPAAEYVQRDLFSAFHCTFEIYPGRQYELRPLSITPKANANQLYTMRLQVVKGDQPLPSPGMSTMVTILSRPSEAVEEMSVPTTSLFQTEGGSFIYRYAPAAGKIERVAVEMVRPLSNGRVIVRSALLHPNDCVIASGVRHLKDGDAVTPLPAPSPSNVGGLL